MAHNDFYDERNEEQPELSGLFHSFFCWLAEIRWLTALGTFISTRWRALKIQCARGWFHFRRGQITRHQRDQQAKESSRLVKTAERVKATPATLYGLYHTDRAWFFTTITGTIGLILLLLWFYQLWITSPGIEQTEVIVNNSASSTPTRLAPDIEEPLFITENPPDSESDSAGIELIVRPGLVLLPSLEEMDVVTVPEIPYRPALLSTFPDGWLPYKERPPERLPPEPLEEPSTDDSNDFPRITFDLDEPAEEVEESQEANILVEKLFPENTSVGQAFQYVLLVTNMGSQFVAQTEVQETIEDSFKIAATSPRALAIGQNLSWTLTNLAPGEKRRIVIDLHPTQIGEKESVVSVQPQIAAKSATIVEEPKLNLIVNQPESAHVGEWLPVTFIVQNRGEGPVSDITLKTELPTQVKHNKGERLVIQIPDLKPGETYRVKLSPRATEVGRAQLNSELLTAGFVQNVSRKTQIRTRRKRGTRPVTTPVTPQQCCPAPVVQPVYPQPVYYQPAMGLNWYRNPIGYW